MAFKFAWELSCGALAWQSDGHLYLIGAQFFLEISSVSQARREFSRRERDQPQDFPLQTKFSSVFSNAREGRTTLFEKNVMVREKALQPNWYDVCVCV